MRKAPYIPTDVYLAYMRVGYRGLDKIRRFVMTFYSMVAFNSANNSSMSTP